MRRAKKAKPKAIEDRAFKLRQAAFLLKCLEDMDRHGMDLSLRFINVAREFVEAVAAQLEQETQTGGAK